MSNELNEEINDIDLFWEAYIVNYLTTNETTTACTVYCNAVLRTTFQVKAKPQKFGHFPNPNPWSDHNQTWQNW